MPEQETNPNEEIFEGQLEFNLYAPSGAKLTEINDLSNERRITVPKPNGATVTIGFYIAIEIWDDPELDPRKATASELNALGIDLQYREATQVTQRLKP